MINHPITKASLGLFLGVVGLGLMGAGAFWAVEHKEEAVALFDDYEPSGITPSIQAETETCEAQLKKTGLEAVEVGGDRVVISMPEFPEPETAIALSSLATYICPTHELRHFCFGTECDVPLSMRIHHRDTP